MIPKYHSDAKKNNKLVIQSTWVINPPRGEKQHAREGVPKWKNARLSSRIISHKDRLDGATARLKEIIVMYKHEWRASRVRLRIRF